LETSKGLWTTLNTISLNLVRAVNATTRAAAPTEAGCTRSGYQRQSDERSSGSTKPSVTWPNSSDPRNHYWLQAPGSAIGSALPPRLTNKAIALEQLGPAGAAIACQVLARTPNKFRVKILAAVGSNTCREDVMSLTVDRFLVPSVPKHPSRRPPPIISPSGIFSADEPYINCNET